MFIRVHVSVHALAVQVREITHFSAKPDTTTPIRSPRWKNGGAGTVRAVLTSAAETKGTSELKKKTPKTSQGSWSCLNTHRVTENDGYRTQSYRQVC